MGKYEKYAVIVIIVAILIRLSLTAAYHPAGDACWQLSNSRFIAENKKIPLFEQFGRDEPFWPPPLFHIVSAIVYGSLLSIGKNIATHAVRFVTPILGVLTLIIFYFIAKKLFNSRIAFLSLFFLSFIPLHIDYSVFSYVDSMVTFLAVLSIYLALRNKITATAITAGLAILTKYNGAFIVPVLLFIIYANNKDLKNKDLKKLLSKLAITILIIAFIGSIWFIRNWIHLGNPVYPFFNSVFDGIQAGTFAQSEVGKINLPSIFNIRGIISFYIGFFGIPDGNIEALSFFNIPYVNVLFIVWLIATITFSIPIILGIFNKQLRHKKILLIWIVSYIVLILFYVINASWSVSRFMLPAVPALALLWAFGLENLRPYAKKIFTIIIFAIAFGFIVTSFVKITLAANSWNSYNEDFEWIRTNTDKDALVMTGSQCISYNIQRQTVSPKLENIGKADYIFVNQDFKLDRRAELGDSLIREINNRNIQQVYENEETGTDVYAGK